MTEVRIRLIMPEMAVACLIGSVRNLQASFRGWRRDPHNDETRDWGVNIEGVGGEIAVAKHRNVYWVPVWGDPSASDAGPWEVRTNCSRRWNDMLVRKRDEKKRDRVFISVLSFMPEFVILGWKLGADCMQDKYWDSRGVGDPAWWVPRADLESIETLPVPGQRRRPLVSVVS